ncbi:hypothetical protein EPICR_40294 [Candidatus Desulfarcum epimagneticum]|uniref:Uncharacterized protein n=1 Tax=uncultured Desulfobacteraceae bacterium TaxID=218296 RepID=A0A484HIX9_9BACT|nr:hypothetical protein EPICR_40294 [uncultured Desulfobacteraceae bacterium]
MAGKRYDFFCPNPECEGKYTLHIEMEEGAVLSLECPYCGEEYKDKIQEQSADPILYSIPDDRFG